MDKISTVTGIAVPLERSNVDTDQIIPAEFLKRVTKTGFEDALFHGWRQDPDFVLNQPAYAAALSIILFVATSVLAGLQIRLMSRNARF